MLQQIRLIGYLHDADPDPGGKGYHITELNVSVLALDNAGPDQVAPMVANGFRSAKTVRKFDLAF
jgi:hypothetical protein